MRHQQADEWALEREAQEKRSPRAIQLHADLMAAADSGRLDRDQREHARQVARWLYELVELRQEVGEETECVARRIFGLEEARS